MTLSVAKRPFGDDLVQDSGPGHMSYGEMPWQLQQLHLYTGSDMAHLDPRLQPVPPWTTDMNARPLPSPPGTHLVQFVHCFVSVQCALMLLVL